MKSSSQPTLRHRLPELRFGTDALAPFLSAETLDLHHGKHHRAYVEKLNGLIEGTELESLGLIDLLRRAEGSTLDNAGQHFNHSFYWRCVAPGEVREPRGELGRLLEAEFGSLADLGQAFASASTSLFGSGWSWLVLDAQSRPRIRQTSNAGCPVSEGEVPLLTCDVWEHAYYVDYRNQRPDYVDAFWKSIDWGFVERVFENPSDLEQAIL